MTTTTVAPKRIQLRRTKGWRKPDDAICVGRPSRWGNPFHIRDHFPAERAVAAFATYLACTTDELMAPHHREGYPTDAEIREHLAGRDLACWCPDGQPCHADVLLEIANRP